MRPTHKPADRRLPVFASLTKAPIAMAATAATAAGYALFAEKLELGMVLPILGVFLLAGGSCALNHVQDARLDARMARTRRRPIPAGRTDRLTAGFIAGTLILTGLYTLACIERHTGTLMLLAGFAVLWYNGVYTYLKRVTAFAVVPGSVVGAVPALIGWTAAGGVVTDPTILLIALFYVVWQIPHFWLLLLTHADEYHNAALPVPTQTFSTRQLARITAAWILAAATAGILIAALIDVRAPWNVVVLVVSIALAWRARPFLGKSPDLACAKPAFRFLIIYILITTACLTVDAIVH